MSEAESNPTIRQVIQKLLEFEDLDVPLIIKREKLHSSSHEDLVFNLNSFGSTKKQSGFIVYDEHIPS